MSKQILKDLHKDFCIIDRKAIALVLDDLLRLMKVLRRLLHGRKI